MQDSQQKHLNGLVQGLTKIRFIGATLQPHPLLRALYQEVTDQFVGQIATCGKMTALRREILETQFFLTLCLQFVFYLIKKTTPKCIFSQKNTAGFLSRKELHETD